MVVLAHFEKEVEFIGKRGVRRFWENEMHILYCTDAKFGEVAGMFLTEKHSPDALITGTERWACASGSLSLSGIVRVKHRTLCTGCGLDPITASGVAWLWWVLLTKSTGCLGCVRWCESSGPTCLTNSLHTWLVCTGRACPLVHFWLLEIDARGSLSGHMVVL